jgi:hypothetical protein
MNRFAPKLSWPGLAVFFLATGCAPEPTGRPAGESSGNPETGETGGTGDDEGEVPDASCEEHEVGAAVVRRMTRLEYANTIGDLLGLDGSVADGFVPEEEVFGFDNNSEQATVGELAAEQYMAAAETLAEQAVMDLSTLLPCDPEASGEEECAQAFVEDFGRRAFRRPLDQDQVDRLMDVFAWGRAEEGFAFGIQLVVEVVLQSPSFLYRVELSPADAGEGDVVALDDWEVASRLSYLLWNGMPDEELFAVAEAGELSTPEQVRVQAERMLDDPRAESVVQDFYRQFLDLDRLETTAKDPEAFPDFTPEIRDLMRAETERFLAHVVFEDDGTWNTMLTADYAFLNGALGNYYGLVDVTGAELQRVDLPEGSHRGGLLTHGSLMSVLGKYDLSSPVHRGKFVREQLLCQSMPPPPDVEFDPPELDPNSTTPQKFEEHSENPACAACHQLMDPIGFGFEHYDGVGQWRATENGFPVDATGEVLQGGDATGQFYGVDQLSTLLSDSDDVRDCMVRQWFRYAYGREKADEDECTENSLRARFAEHGSVRDLLLDLTQTDAFLYARRDTEGD